MKIWIGLVFTASCFVFFLLGCGAQPKVSYVPRDSLQAQLSVSSSLIRNAKELNVNVIITNKDSLPIRLNTLLLSIAPVVIQIQDESGKRISLGNSVLPSFDDASNSIFELRPGDTIRFKYPGAAIFKTSPQPGNYSVRFLFQQIGWGVEQSGEAILQSNWSAFTLAQ